ncbi:putative FUN14 family [Trypanosoma cruzi]|nr:putative FUN14 family [Trypanosoma cruzi]
MYKKKTQEEKHAARAVPHGIFKSTNVIGKLSTGIGVCGLMGTAVGVAAKRLTQDAFYGAGIAVIALQSLSYLGYIQINWKKVESEITQALDHDGNGKIDAKDFHFYLNRFLKFAGNGISDLSAFAAGFFFGSRYLA